MMLISSLFCDVTQHVVLIHYRRIGTTYPSLLQGQRNPRRIKSEDRTDRLSRNVGKELDCVWNVMAHAQKPDFVFRRNRRVHLNRQGRQFSRLLAAEVCASAVVMLDTPCSEVVCRVLATPLHLPVSPSLPLPCVTVCHHISTGLYHYKLRNSPEEHRFHLLHGRSLKYLINVLKNPPLCRNLSQWNTIHNSVTNFSKKKKIILSSKHISFECSFLGFYGQNFVYIFYLPVQLTHSYGRWVSC